MKILANDGISAIGAEILTQAGFEVVTIKVAQNQLINYINEHNIAILLVRSATKVFDDVINACPSLKLIGRGGVGLDNIDVKLAQSKGIKVINTPAASSHSVAELVFAHFLSGARFLHDAHRRMPLEGDTQFDTLKKEYSQGVELKGKTLGVIGLGRIGKAVAQVGLGLGMKVITFDPFHSEHSVELTFFDGRKLNFEIPALSKEEVLAQADFITLHIPAQKEYIIDEKEITLMKQGVSIVNAARGGVINESALMKALDSGKIGFVGLDVYENEPTPSMHLLMHPNISHTPHIGAATTEAQERISVELAEQIISIFKQ